MYENRIRVKIYCSKTHERTSERTNELRLAVRIYLFFSSLIIKLLKLSMEEKKKELSNGFPFLILNVRNHSAQCNGILPGMVRK